MLKNRIVAFIWILLIVVIILSMIIYVIYANNEAMKTMLEVFLNV